MLPNNNIYAVVKNKPKHNNITQRKKKRKKRKIKKYAKWMKHGSSTPQEEITKFILDSEAPKLGIFMIKNQHPFYNKEKDKWYIADFYIPDLKLVIEVDGPDHYKNNSQIEYDFIRTKFLEKLGLSVTRIKNEEVKNKYFGSFLRKILVNRLNELKLAGTLKLSHPSCKIRVDNKKKSKKKNKITKVDTQKKFTSRVILRKASRDPKDYRLDWSLYNSFRKLIERIQ